jgi:hypothetical protein
MKYIYSQKKRVAFPALLCSVSELIYGVLISLYDAWENSHAESAIYARLYTES